MTSYGIPATYWKIIRTDIAYQTNKSDQPTDQVLIGGYFDKKSRQNNAEPLMVIVQYHNLNDMARPNCYDIIKQSRMVMNEDTGELEETNILAGAQDI